MMDFRDKIAFVTGATSGIGRGTAIAFARRGATVVVAGRSEKEGRDTLDAVRGAGSDGMFLKFDVAIESEVAGAIDDTISRYGRLDCTVNCAAIDIAHPLTEFSAADYDAVFNANVKGVLFCLKYQILAMQRRGGAIVNVGSVSAQMSDIGNALYNASKAAMRSLTRTAAHEAAQYKIRVNEVAPGPTKAPMLERFLEKAAAAGSPFNTESIVANIPMGRLATVDEIANAVLFLSSDQSAHTTGALLTVDGGFLLG
jgi:NAD(P)-dependent dehydrogenase (short-subunit alcohol dehydrogenase family)